MLVIGVRRQERIRLAVAGTGHVIWVTLVQTSGEDGRTRLGFEAPQEVRILREKLIRREPRQEVRGRGGEPS